MKPSQQTLGGSGQTVYDQNGNVVQNPQIGGQYFNEFNDPVVFTEYGPVPVQAFGPIVDGSGVGGSGGGALGMLMTLLGNLGGGGGGFGIPGSPSNGGSSGGVGESHRYPKPNALIFQLFHTQKRGQDFPWPRFYCPL